MKISKYIHSCLLVEDKGKTVLLDPGIFTYQAKVFPLSTLTALDYILITHEHIDHLSVPFVRALLEKFPKALLISNAGVATVLQKEGIAVQTDGNEFIVMEDAVHEKLFPGWPIAQNTLFTLFGQLTDPGDSLHFAKTTKFLALPVQAPWGSLIASAEKAAELKPEVVIPIHDWHWSEEACVGSYQMLQKFFESQGIEFKGLQTGEVIEIE